jgi:hypothetical protein
LHAIVWVSKLFLLFKIKIPREIFRGLHRLLAGPVLSHYFHSLTSGIPGSWRSDRRSPSPPPLRLPFVPPTTPPPLPFTFSMVLTKSQLNYLTNVTG